MPDMLECPGCVQQLLYPAQHATSCPAFTGHALNRIVAGLYECECGGINAELRSRLAHIDQVKREAAQ